MKKSEFKIKAEIRRLNRMKAKAKSRMQAKEYDESEEGQTEFTVWSHIIMQIEGAVEALEWVIGKRNEIIGETKE